MFSKTIKEGVYLGELILNVADNIILPFNFEVTYKDHKPLIIIRNADERITVDEINIHGDSIHFKMPVFDTEFRCKFTKTGFEGIWVNHYRQNNSIRFKATHNENLRFKFPVEKRDGDFSGKWEVTFSPALPDSSKAVGSFKNVEQSEILHGTFLTETGDYRFLEGVQSGNKMYLSAFDGSHAYLFIGELKGEQIAGTFYSGSHWTEKWTGRRNEKFSLRDAEEITYVKNKEEEVRFSFYNLEGKLVSLTDPQYTNKPVIIQLMGSWCPNCMDETKYLTEVYRKYRSEGLEVVAVAFEKTTDPVKAKEQVKRMRDRLAVPYEVLLSGETGKNKASEIFNNVNRVIAFPTTIFLDKDHRVVKIHTGFSGPATGQDYIIFKERTENLIKTLLKS